MNHVECSVPSCGNPVFASGKCRKHYEQERLATAAPCSISGCSKKRYRGDLCITHYRLETLKNRPMCVVPNCGNHQKNFTSSLCGKHEFRARRHATMNSQRPADWGAREQHPLYKTYCWHKRQGATSMCQEWRDDFWAFVSTVGEKPENHTLRRNGTNLPIGPGNWYWKESVSNKDKAAYQREWRKNNPERAKSYDLKRMYGVTTEQYNDMETAQNGLCAICNQPESSKDKDGGPRMLAVDHCHETGKVRGLLCSGCNTALGGFKDSVQLLDAANNYLLNHVDTPQNKRTL